MEHLELKCLKNKSELIASLSLAEHVVLQSCRDVNEILDKLNKLKRAVIFEEVDAVKEIAKDLRIGQRSCCHPYSIDNGNSDNEYVSGFETLIDSINTATAKCSKAKLISM